ncbi:protein snwA-like [Thrips palmi]|uniref:Protein snwA-like n=1 Tax=Thrips palmi TaxID=161013 RepID=A0A6P8ZME1_THRPL|nr:protein snwA-like [Thrips palmi]
MWLVIDGDDRSYSRVHEKNVLQAGSGIAVNQKVKFFYRGEEHHGTVLMINADFNKCDEEINRLCKLPRNRPPPKNLVSDIPILNKRRSLQSKPVDPEITQPKPAVPVKTKSKKKKKEKTEGPEMTEAEKTRLRILARNKAEAQRQANAALLSKTIRNRDESDDEWLPDEDGSVDSVVNFASHKSKLADNENDLLKSLGQRTSRDSSPAGFRPDTPDATNSNSPSKDELQKQIALLKKQLEAKKDNADKDNDGKDKMETKENKKVDKESIENVKERKRAESGKKVNTENPQEKDNGGEDGNEDLDESEDKNSSFSRRSDADDMNVDEVLEEQNDDLDADKLRDEELKDQLYGDLHGETKELGRNIFCKKDVLTSALTNATNVNTLARRLLSGVFIPSKIIDCTVTGQVWRPGSKGKEVKIPKPLHHGALKAIVDFSNGVAKRKKWKTKKFAALKSVFAGRLIEIKNQVKAGKLFD